MGTFAEYFAGVGAARWSKIPDALGDEEAPLACGGLTAYGAVKKLLKHHVMPGRPIAIIGAAGGLGHYAVQIANAFGYEVIGIDVGEERLDFVKSLGAARAVGRRRRARACVHGEFGGVDASLVFSAKMAGFRLGFDLLGPARLLVCVGSAADRARATSSSTRSSSSRRTRRSSTRPSAPCRTCASSSSLAAAGKVKSHVSRTGRSRSSPTSSTSSRPRSTSAAPCSPTSRVSAPSARIAHAKGRGRAKRDIRAEPTTAAGAPGARAAPSSAVRSDAPAGEVVPDALRRRVRSARVVRRPPPGSPPIRDAWRACRAYRRTTLGRLRCDR